MVLEAPNDCVLQADLEYIARKTPDPDAFRGRYIAVTGATGLVGSLTVKALCCLNRLQGLGVHVIACVRSREKAQQVLGPLLDRPELTLVQWDASRPLSIEGPVDYLIHTASATASKYFVTRPVETLLTAVDGTRHALELARQKQARGMVYVSSMEAFGVTDPGLAQVQEPDLGYVDILSVRSSYSEGKRACECLCAAYASEYGVPVRIARLAQTFGAGVSREDNRVFAQFTRSCLAGQDIVLHTRGASVGNYCYTADTVAALLTLLLRGEAGQAYTVANETASMPIRSVAELASQTLSGGKVGIVFDIPKDSMTYGYAPDVTMHLSSAKLRALGWTPEVPLPEMFRRLAESFRQQGI